MRAMLFCSTLRFPGT